MTRPLYYAWRVSLYKGLTASITIYNHYSHPFLPAISIHILFSSLYLQLTHDKEGTTVRKRRPIGSYHYLPYSLPLEKI